MQVMTDIEVYGDRLGGRVFQLSAVAFDMDGKINDPHELMQSEDFWFDAVTYEYPLSVGQDTIDWWAAPEQAVGREVLLRSLSERREPLRDILKRFERFTRVRLGKSGGHWANAPTYDLEIIRALYKSVFPGGALKPGWSFRQERCMRTIMVLAKKLSPIKLPDMDGIGLIKHNGLHDAARQAVLVQAAYRALGLNAGDYARSTRAAGAAS